MDTHDRPDVEPHPYRTAAPWPAVQPPPASWRRLRVGAVPALRASSWWRAWAGGRWIFGVPGTGPRDPRVLLAIADLRHWHPVDACPCDPFEMRRPPDDVGGGWLTQHCMCEVHP